MIRQLQAAVLFLALAPLAQAASYTIDPNHSSCVFKVGHLGIGKIYGRFSQISGTFTTDGEGTLTAASVNVKTQTVDTTVTRRDDHLKSADFLNVAQFPLMTFRTTNVLAQDSGKYELTGDFTLHGVTRSVTLEMEQTGRAADGSRVGSEGTFTIKRTDFGMANLLDQAGDEIQILLAFEGIKQ